MLQLARKEQSSPKILIKNTYTEEETLLTRIMESLNVMPEKVIKKIF